MAPQQPDPWQQDYECQSAAGFPQQAAGPVQQAPASATYCLSDYSFGGG